MPNVTNPSTSRQSQALVADARRKMAARKARSSAILAEHKTSRTQQKAQSRDLIEEAREEAAVRLERSRRARLEQWSPDFHRRPY